MELNTDLHLHSPYARGVSPRMQPEILIAAAARKGIGAIGTGDALHPAWREAWASQLENDQGIVVVPTVEVQAERRVHHLAVFPDFDAVEVFGDLLPTDKCRFESDGRPHVRVEGGRVVAAVHEAGGLAGPAHAFTPWTGCYSAFSSLRDCYGDEQIDFLELGLSADSSYGAGIFELHDVPFISSSDAHSPELHRIGREFTRLDVQEPSAAGVMEALRRGRVVVNVGLFPEEGKYNETACTRCGQHIPLTEAIELRWRCPFDGGLVKKGVRDRAHELWDDSPRLRPRYLHLIPLGEVIAVVLGVSSPNTRRVQLVHEAYLKRFSTEIAVLVDEPIDALVKVHPGVGRAIGALREGLATLHPGGGGRYGTFELPMT